MATSVKNIRRFFKDHPELSPYEKKVLARARSVSIEGRIIPWSKIDSLMENMAPQFLAEASYHPAHQQIALNELSKIG